MIGNRTSRAWLIIGILIIIGGVLLGGFLFFGDSKMETYATFNSPDGRYKIEVLKIKPFFGTAPGQSGDSPGEVRLLNKDGEVIEKTDVEMVQLIEKVEWTNDSVYIKLVADWKLPK